MCMSIYVGRHSVSQCITIEGPWKLLSALSMGMAMFCKWKSAVTEFRKHNSEPNTVCRIHSAISYVDFFKKNINYYCNVFMDTHL